MVPRAENTAADVGPLTGVGTSAVATPSTETRRVASVVSGSKAQPHTRTPPGTAITFSTLPIGEPSTVTDVQPSCGLVLPGPVLMA